MSGMESMCEFRGVIPILQTPFYPDGRLDLDSLRREARFAAAAGVRAVAFPGFASEWWKLSQDEIFACAGAIAEVLPPHARLIANITAQSTYLACEHARRFAALGAGALMCLPPFLPSSVPGAALPHLRAVLSAMPCPFILQYSSSLTGSVFTPEELVDLHREFPHFNCVKLDFVAAGPAIGRLAAAFSGARMTFLIGFAGLQLPDALERGAHGMMPGTGHLPEDLHVFDRLQADREAGLDAFERLLPLLNLEMQSVEISISVHKRLLRERGIFESDRVREPGGTLDAVQEAQMLRHFRRAEAMATRARRGLGVEI